MLRDFQLHLNETLPQTQCSKADQYHSILLIYNNSSFNPSEIITLIISLVINWNIFIPWQFFSLAYFTLKFIILQFPSQNFTKVKQNVVCSFARYALELEAGKWQMCLFLQKQKINFKTLLEVIWLNSTAFGLHLL